MKNYLLFRKIFRLILNVIIFAAISLPFCVNAAVGTLVTESITTRNNRIFEIPIGVNLDKKMTAATFTLSYNTDDMEFRGVEAVAENCMVKAVDDKGKTKVIFVCADGVKFSDSPVLVAVKYKKISENNCKVKIKVSDCVDSSVKNFEPPASTICDIKYSPNASDNQKSKYKYKSSTKASDSKISKDKTKNNNEVAGDENFDSEQSPNSTIDTVAGGNRYPVFIAVVIITALFASSLTAAVIVRKEKNKKSENNEENK